MTDEELQSGTAAAADTENAKELTSINGPKPRQWLIDRSNGQSKVDAERLGRPFCPLCWPPPCVKMAPDFFEQNACCEGFGKIGVFPENEEKSRVWLMRKSMLVHFVGMILSILSCLAISSNSSLLQSFAFSSGTVTGTVGDTDIQQVEFKVGLTTIYVKDFFFGERTYDLDELCLGQNLGIPLTSTEDCESCADVSAGLVATLVMGVITYLPTIASNVNRSYYNYDVNCQKVFGTIVALFSGAMSLYTWLGYANICFASFFDGDVTIPVWVPLGAGNGSTYDPAEYKPYIAQYFNLSDLDDTSLQDLDPAEVVDIFSSVRNETLAAGAEIRVAQVTFDWNPGTGYILIIVATLLKMIDIINHFLIKTPSITRDLEEQLEYEQKYGGGDKTEAAQLAKMEASE